MPRQPPNLCLQLFCTYHISSYFHALALLSLFVLRIYCTEISLSLQQSIDRNLLQLNLEVLKEPFAVSSIRFTADGRGEATLTLESSPSGCVTARSLGVFQKCCPSTAPLVAADHSRRHITHGHASERIQYLFRASPRL